MVPEQAGSKRADAATVAAARAAAPTSVDGDVVMKRARSRPEKYRKVECAAGGIEEPRSSMEITKKIKLSICRRLHSSPKAKAPNQPTTKQPTNQPTDRPTDQPIHFKRKRERFQTYQAEQQKLQRNFVGYVLSLLTSGCVTSFLCDDSKSAISVSKKLTSAIS
jgi:hypothetical protein